MMELFRRVALMEGVTTVLLFLVAMPLKYMADWPHLVPLAGWLHGGAFLGYLIVMMVAFAHARVGPVGWIRAVAAALVPFGTFANSAYVSRTAASAANRRATSRLKHGGSAGSSGDPPE